MSHVEVNGLQLWVETGGEGPPVLFISGTGGDLRRHPNVLDGPLVDAFAVATYDQRNLGRSSRPASRPTMADYADDAAGVLDALGWDRVPVVGVSFGGMVAQELALRHPGRVQRLVLCCTSSGGTGGASYPLHELTALSEDERVARTVALGDARLDQAWQVAHPDAVATMAQAMRPIDDSRDARLGAARQLEARRGHDTYGRLGGIAVPTLVCAGRYDGIAPLRNAEALVEAIPHACLEVFDGGHLFLLQDGRAWPTIIEFLRDAQR